MAFRDLLGALRLDLIQRRLLPIPLLLGALLIAVPVIVSGRRSTPVLPSASAATPAPVAAPARHVPQRAAPPAKVAAPVDRNPFPTTKAEPAAPAASAPASSPTPSAAGTTTGARPAATAPSSATTSPPARSTPSVRTVPAAPTGLITAKLPDGQTLVATRSGVYKVSAIDLRFGTAIVPKIRRDVARLSAFPSPAHPAAILLGSRVDYESAVFAIAGGVAVTGDGTCVPRRRLCTQLVLRKGQRALLTQADGTRLRLELVRVRRRHVHSLAAAIRATARESAAGRCVYDAVSAYVYDPSTGAMRRAADPSACRYPQLDQETSG